MQHISATHPSRIISFCPKCGASDFTFDSEKAFNCGSCGFRYYINPAPAVAAILQAPDGRIVLTRRKFDPGAGKFDLPGGFVDMMEPAENAVRREILEELGVTVTSMKFLASFPNEYAFRGISYFTCDLAFVCETSGLSKMQPSDDVDEAVLVSPYEIDYNSISFPSVISILKTYIETLDHKKGRS